ncbi:MAG: 6-bladed beta-propeller [Chroococcidiopsidaceae cyanobacterium CP_BM_RX_35]|nr:6-bladed beta-propeller [Chroococcidiopsidaceae cyanobacterium CP_BM_RX_35]
MRNLMLATAGAVVIALGIVDKAQAAAFSFLYAFGSPGRGPGQFFSPVSPIVDSFGNIYVADDANDNVQEFSSSGTLLSTLGDPGGAPEQFIPDGLAVDNQTGNIFVNDYNNARIDVFSNGRFLYYFNIMSQAGGLVINGGKVYVSLESNSQIAVYDTSGSLLSTFGSAGIAPGELGVPEGLAVDQLRNLYVADPSNNRISAFDSSGGFLSYFGSAGNGSGQFNSPFDVSIDTSGKVYVADSFNNRIQVFDSRGSFLTAFGSFGSKPGQFVTPEGVAVDSQSGNVYVADSGNGRIEVFTGTSILPTTVHESSETVGIILAGIFGTGFVLKHKLKRQLL